MRCSPAWRCSGSFYIAAFVDVSDKLFKGTVTPLTMLEYFRYSTPQMAVLHRSTCCPPERTGHHRHADEEQRADRDEGVRRQPLPRGGADVCRGDGHGGGLFLLQETILGPSTRRADELKQVIKGGSPQSLNLLNNRWLVGSNGQIYHYVALDPRNHVLTGLDVYEFTPSMDRITRRTYADIREYCEPGRKGMANPPRLVTDVRRGGEVKDVADLVAAHRTLESADYFGTEQPNPDFMGYVELRRYTEKLRSAGLPVLKQQVALTRKLAFPFVTLIMTLLAVPFASSIGRSGAMGGIGVGIALAISYWTLISVFRGARRRRSAATGAGGVGPEPAVWSGRPVSAADGADLAPQRPYFTSSIQNCPAIPGLAFTVSTTNRTSRTLATCNVFSATGPAGEARRRTRQPAGTSHPDRFERRHRSPFGSRN
jgi:lipopolysaccharide export LptBFGC system permease protein LptF